MDNNSMVCTTEAQVAKIEAAEGNTNLLTASKAVKPYG